MRFAVPVTVPLCWPETVPWTLPVHAPTRFGHAGPASGGGGGGGGGGGVGAPESFAPWSPALVDPLEPPPLLLPLPVFPCPLLGMLPSVPPHAKRPISRNDRMAFFMVPLSPWAVRQAALRRYFRRGAEKSGTKGDF